MVHELTPLFFNLASSATNNNVHFTARLRPVMYLVLLRAKGNTVFCEMVLRLGDSSYTAVVLLCGVDIHSWLIPCLVMLCSKMLYVVKEWHFYLPFFCPTDGRSWLIDFFCYICICVYIYPPLSPPSVPDASINAFYRNLNSD